MNILSSVFQSLIDAFNKFELVIMCIPRISQPPLFVKAENNRFQMFGAAITIKRTIKFLNYSFTRVY